MLNALFSDSEQGWQNRLTLILIFLFPISVATVSHAGSTIYTALILLGLFHCKGVWAELSHREKRFLIGLVLFFFFSIFSLVMTEDLREGIKRIERYLRLIGLIPIYLMLRKKKLSSGKFYLGGAFVAVFVMAAQAYYEVEILKNEVVFGAYHKIIFGNQAILSVAFVVCAVLFFCRRRLHFFLAILAVMAGLYASLLSGTRTSWLFVPFILICLVGLYRKKISRRIWTYMFFGTLVAILLTLAFPPKRLVSGLQMGWNDLKVFREDKQTHTSWGARLVMWRNSLLIFKASPLIGTGMGDFKNDSLKLFEKGLSYDNDFSVNQTNAHNLYFQLLAEGGLLGLILLITVIFILPFNLLHALWKSTKDRLLHCYSLSGLICLFAFVWFGVSESWVNRNPMITTYCLTTLVFLSSAVNRSEETMESVLQ